MQLFVSFATEKSREKDMSRGGLPHLITEDEVKSHLQFGRAIFRMAVGDEVTKVETVVS